MAKKPVQAEQLPPSPRVGVITALPHETAAVLAVFRHPPETVVPGDGAGRRYWLGPVTANGGTHLVVIAQANMGNNVAAIRASLLLSNFPSVESLIMCGIAGGIPNPERPGEHVRLGDIVISNQKGVVQYDFIKRSGGRKRTGVAEEVRASPRPPSAEMLEAVRLLEVEAHRGHFPWDVHLDEGLAGMKWQRPDHTDDRLADAGDPNRFLAHPEEPERRVGRPRIFLAPIASANTLLKDPVKRDALRDQFGIRAVEMEGSGVADATWTHGVGYLVVRGICDYCDANKNDRWQKYAAMAAAAYVRALLESMPACPTIRGATDGTSHQLQNLTESARTRERIPSPEATRMKDSLPWPLPPDTSKVIDLVEQEIKVTTARIQQQLELWASIQRAKLRLLQLNWRDSDDHEELEHEIETLSRSVQERKTLLYDENRKLQSDLKPLDQQVEQLEQRLEARTGLSQDRFFSRSMIKTLLQFDQTKSGKNTPTLQETFGVDLVAGLKKQMFNQIDETLEELELAKREYYLQDIGDGALIAFNEPKQMLRFVEIFSTKIDRRNREIPNNEMAPFARRWFRFGAATGEVSLDVSRDKLDVNGDLPRKVKRFEEWSEPGVLLMDKETADKLGDEARLDEPEPRKVGKKDEKLLAYRRTILPQAKDEALAAGRWVPASATPG
jgi:nucleoside phosphorylase/class 3 adenylate cyclase